jgi:hypothetical protein
MTMRSNLYTVSGYSIINKLVKKSFADWSPVHGFFAAMGGFVYHGDNGRLHTLSLKDIEALVEKDEIEYPIISKEEIEDKSKGDAVIKGLVLIQTTWFLLHCIARGAQHLFITELELATAAFALLNVITYILWWDKPLNVDCPVRVRKKHVWGQADLQAGDETATEETGERVAFSSRIQGWWVRFWRWWSWSNVWDGLEKVFLVVLWPFVLTMFAADDDDDDDPFFMWKNDDQYSRAFIGVLVVSMIFGGIHCIGWSFPFPSHTEQLLWRIPSIVITSVPLFIVVTVFNADIFNDLPVIVKFPIIVLFILSPFLYLLARGVLLVLAFMALRSLPASALQTVEWTSFLPHV